MGFLGGAALLTAAVAVSKLLGALYKIPLGNLLGSRGMGCFQAAYNVYGVLLTLSTAGLPLAMSRLIAQASKDVRTDFTYLSYTAYANSIAVDSIGQSYHGKLTLHEALQQWGESLKKYGEE